MCGGGVESVCGGVERECVWCREIVCGGVESVWWCRACVVV